MPRRSILHRAARSAGACPRVHGRGRFSPPLRALLTELTVPARRPGDSLPVIRRNAMRPSPARWLGCRARLMSLRSPPWRAQENCSPLRPFARPCVSRRINGARSKAGRRNKLTVSRMNRRREKHGGPQLPRYRLNCRARFESLHMRHELCHFTSPPAALSVVPSSNTAATTMNSSLAAVREASLSS